MKLPRHFFFRHLMTCWTFGLRSDNLFERVMDICRGCASRNFFIVHCNEMIRWNNTKVPVLVFNWILIAQFLFHNHERRPRNRVFLKVCYVAMNVLVYGEMVDRVRASLLHDELWVWMTARLATSKYSEGKYVRGTRCRQRRKRAAKSARVTGPVYRELRSKIVRPKGERKSAGREWEGTGYRAAHGVLAAGKGTSWVTVRHMLLLRRSSPLPLIILSLTRRYIPPLALKTSDLHQGV